MNSKHGTWINRKKAISLVLSLATVGGFALTSHATDTILVDDTWADGNRTSSGTDGGGIDSPWFSSTGASLVANTGSMAATVASASSLTFWTYFEPSGSPASLNVGDTLQVTLNLNFTTPGAQNTSRGFNFGLFDSSAGTRRTSDGGSPVGTGVVGYRQSMNFGTTLGTANALQTQDRSVVSDANLLSTSGDYTTIGVNGGGNAVGATGFAASTAYTIVYSVTRTGASSEDITTTVSGGSLNGTGSITQTVTDTAYLDSTFDTFAMRPTTGATTALGITLTEFKVDDITGVVPEPSTLALAGLGAITLIGASRRNRK